MADFPFLKSLKAVLVSFCEL